MNNLKYILFFDGVCNLCNSLIDFIIRWDKKGVIKVASLQGNTAKRILPSKYTEALDTVVLYQNGEIYTKSNAVIKVLMHLHFIFYPLALFFIIPSFMRDPLYNLVSRYRYKWFGKQSTCRLPTEQEKDYFLP